MGDNKVKLSYYFQLRTDDETGGHKWKLKERRFRIDQKVTKNNQWLK
jgi:hypothetical protein